MLERMCVVVFCVGLVSLPLLAGENEWFAESANGGDEIEDVSCASVTGDVGAAIEFDHGVNSKSIESLGLWGARWNGSYWPSCNELEPSVIATDTVYHSYDEEGTSDSESLSVIQITTPWASGAARQLDETTEWWWYPTVTVVDSPPQVWMFTNGSWQAQGWDEMDEDNAQGSSNASFVVLEDDPTMPGHMRMEPVAGGAGGSFGGSKVLPEGPGGMMQVRFELFASANRSLDNTTALQWVEGLLYDLTTEVQ
ncbi:MAG: hypothetical protein GY733_01540 [bacterium]|nr:hypothetical protein [bacterium]